MAHPARANRVKFAAALAARLVQIEESVTSGEKSTLPASWWQRLLDSLRGQRPTLRFAIALATLLVVLGGVWLLVESRRRQQSELARTQADREAQEQRERPRLGQPTPNETKLAEHNPQQIPQPMPTPTLDSAPRSVSLALTVGGVRGGDKTKTPTLIIPPGTTQARLLVNLKENNYSSYRASLQTITGVEIFSQTNVKPGRTKTGVSFVFTVPAHKFASGDYVLTLRGIDPDGEIDDLSKSLFRVEKK
jgi:hypothetical protein